MIITEERQKQLIADCERAISQLKNLIEFTNSDKSRADLESQLERQQIALTALEARPGLFEWKFKEDPPSPWVSLPIGRLEQCVGDMSEYLFWHGLPRVPVKKSI